MEHIISELEDKYSMNKKAEWLTAQATQTFLREIYYT